VQDFGSGLGLWVTSDVSAVWLSLWQERGYIVVNLKTIKELGLTASSTLRAMADEIIE
jgi:hypothetical protein